MVRLLMLAVLMAGVAGAAAAQSAPVVVEMFTSKYCPNCPSAEHKLKGVAAENPDLLVVFEHVDYWSQPGTGRTDPFGLTDVTQRQYDYCGARGMRPGQVFTPMPLIDGEWMAQPPLMFSWNDTLAKARAAAPKPRLDVARGAEGGLEIGLPAMKGEHEVWVLGVEKISGTSVWRTMGIAQAEVAGGKATLAPALTPKTPAAVVLMQKPGPRGVVAAGTIGI